MKRVVTLRIDSDIWIRAKHAAIDLNITLGDLVQKALEQTLTSLTTIGPNSNRPLEGGANNNGE